MLGPLVLGSSVYLLSLEGVRDRVSLPTRYAHDSSSKIFRERGGVAILRSLAHAFHAMFSCLEDFMAL